MEQVNKDGWKSVYVLLFNDGLTKIGVSANVSKRITQIQTNSGRKVVDFYETEKCSNAFSIEKELLNIFQKNKVGGEFFLGVYEDAVKELKNTFFKNAEFISKERKPYPTFNEVVNPQKPFCNSCFSSLFLETTLGTARQGLLKAVEAFTELCGDEDEICTKEAVDMLKKFDDVLFYLNDLSEISLE